MCLLLLLLRYSYAHREHLKNSTLHFVAAVCIVAIIVHDCRMPVKANYLYWSGHLYVGASGVIVLVACNPGHLWTGGGES